MPENDIDFLRARYAIDTVSARYRSPHSVDQKNSKGYSLKEYRSTALSAGSFIRQCGLLQVFAFYHSKGKADVALMNDIVEWLGHNDAALTRSICAESSRCATPIRSGETTAILQALVQRDSQEVALLEEEAEAVLLWIKRVVEGIYQKTKAKKKQSSGGNGVTRPDTEPQAAVATERT
jgi:CRISPR type III-B/RAMP module-associated protein Cmr5